MRLPSLRQILQDSSTTLRRFPLVIADAVVGSAIALVLIDYEGPHAPTALFKILFATIFGIPVLISATVLTEKRKLSPSLTLACQAIAVLLLVGYAFTVPSDLQDAPNIHCMSSESFGQIMFSIKR